MMIGGKYIKVLQILINLADFDLWCFQCETCMHTKSAFLSAGRKSYLSLIFVKP